MSEGPSDNSTVFSAEATAITLILDYYWYMETMRHQIKLVYSEPMFCLQGTEDKGTKNRLIG